MTDLLEPATVTLVQPSLPALAALRFGIALIFTTGFASPSSAPQRGPRYAPRPRLSLPLRESVMVRSGSHSAFGPGFWVRSSSRRSSTFTDHLR